MFNNLTFDMKNRFLKVGLEAMLNNVSISSHIRTELLAQTVSYSGMVFTDRLATLFKSIEHHQEKLIVYCGDAGSIYAWSWLPENIVSWHQAFPHFPAANSAIHCRVKNKRPLSLKESCVLRMVAAGKRRSVISAELCMPTRTVNDLKARGMDKLGITNNRELLLWSRYCHSE